MPSEESDLLCRDLLELPWHNTGITPRASPVERIGPMSNWIHACHRNRAGATSSTLYCLCIQTVGYSIIDGVLVHIRSTAPITHDR